MTSLRTLVLFYAYNIARLFCCQEAFGRDLGLPFGRKVQTHPRGARFGNDALLGAQPVEDVADLGGRPLQALAIDEEQAADDEDR